MTRTGYLAARPDPTGTPRHGSNTVIHFNTLCVWLTDATRVVGLAVRHRGDTATVPAYGVTLPVCQQCGNYPLTRDGSWRAQALCDPENTPGVDPSWWFQPTQGGSDEQHAAAFEAKRICRECPVITECRDYATVTRQPYGIWAGEAASTRATRTRNQRRRETAAAS